MLSGGGRECRLGRGQRRSVRGLVGGLARSQGEHFTCSVPAAPHACLLPDGRRDPGVPRRPSVARCPAQGPTLE